MNAPSVLAKIRTCIVALPLFLVPQLSSANQALDEIVNSSSLSGSFLAARIATGDNDDVAAVRFLEKSLALDSDNVELKRNLFHAYLANGRVDDAVSIAREIPQADRNGQVINLVTGIDLIRKRSYQKAIEAFDNVKGSDLDNLMATVVGAWARLGLGDRDAALALINKLSGPDWMEVIKGLHVGLVNSQAGDDEAAVASLAKVVEQRQAAGFLSETYIHAVYALANANQRLGKLDEAKKTIDNALEIFPNHPTLNSKRKWLDEGIKSVPLLSSPAQGAGELFYNIGNAIGREGGTPFAQIYLQIARYLNPKDAQIAISLASVFERQKNPKRANELYEQIGEDSPYKRRALLESAINMNSLEDVEGAIANLRKLIELEPEDLVPYMTLGRVLNQHERYREAAEIFENAIAKIGTPERKHWDYFYRLAIAYERLKEWPKAEPKFKKALELSPDQANVLNYLGYSWVDQGINLEEGLEMIRKAVELRPRAGFIVDSLGWAYYKLGRYDDAVTELERAIAILPQDPVVNDHLGDAYYKVGRKLEAQFQWKHALDAKPEPEDEVKIRKKLEAGRLIEDSNPVAKSE